MEVLINYFIGVKNIDEINNNDVECIPSIVNEYLSESTQGYGKLFMLTDNESFVFNGLIVNGQMTGECFIKFINDKRYPEYKSYSGNLSNGQFHGVGTIVYTNGDTFIGMFNNGQKNGAGKMYNGNGDLIMDNIWKNDVVCGKVNFTEHYHGTKQLKVSGVLFNSIKVGTWIYYKENGTISKIEYYKDFDVSEINDGQIEDSSTSLNSDKEKEIITHDSGYIISQIINPNLEKYSIEELCLSLYPSYKEKLSVKSSTKSSTISATISAINLEQKTVKKVFLKKKVSPENQSLDKGVNEVNEVNEFNEKQLYDTIIKQCALPVSNIKEGTMVLYLDIKGCMSSIAEYIGGKFYDKMLPLPNFNVQSNQSVQLPKVSKNSSASISTSTTTTTKTYYLINNNNLNETTNEVSTTSSIYVIDTNDEVQLPMLYYEGDMLNGLAHGTGTIYSNGRINFSGTFEKGQLIKGMQFSSVSDEIYMSYNGSFKDNIPHGEGSFFNKCCVKIYEGQINEGKYNGNGISYWDTTGAMNWEGKWRNHQKHGKGRLYDDTGSLICNCTFEHDQMSFVE